MRRRPLLRPRLRPPVAPLRPVPPVRRVVVRPRRGCRFFVSSVLLLLAAVLLAVVLLV